MKGWGVFWFSILVACMVWYEWPNFHPKQKKEKAAFIVLSAAGWLLGTLLMYFPDLPSPTQLLIVIFGPLGKLLEKQ